MTIRERLEQELVTKSALNPKLSLDLSRYYPVARWKLDYPNNPVLKLPPNTLSVNEAKRLALFILDTITDGD